MYKNIVAAVDATAADTVFSSSFLLLGFISIYGISYIMLCECVDIVNIICKCQLICDYVRSIMSSL